MATILVVDDEPDVVEIVSFCLDKEGHLVLAAADGRSGIARARTHRPDLIILDVMMPGMDGFDVLFDLKHHPRTSAIPVIMLTAVPDRSSAPKGEGANEEAYITKPFEADTLTATVRDVLSKLSKRGRPDPEHHSEHHSDGAFLPGEPTESVAQEQPL